MAKETRVQSQAVSYQRLKTMVLDISLLNTQHYKVCIVTRRDLALIWKKQKEKEEKKKKKTEVTILSSQLKMKS